MESFHEPEATVNHHIRNTRNAVIALGGIGALGVVGNLTSAAVSALNHAPYNEQLGVATREAAILAGGGVIIEVTRRLIKRSI